MKIVVPEVGWAFGVRLPGTIGMMPASRSTRVGLGVRWNVPWKWGIPPARGDDLRPRRPWHHRRLFPEI